MTSGRLYAVAGPSGAGKDTLMKEACRQRPDIVLARRVITRPSAAGGEDFEGVSEAEFTARLARDEFAFWWQAHGLRYGVPAAIDSDLSAGRTILFNASRRILRDAARRYPGLVVLYVTAPPDILVDRLARRGRESSEEITARLARVEDALPGHLPLRYINNDGSVAVGAERLLAALQPEGAQRCTGWS